MEGVTLTTLPDSKVEIRGEVSARDFEKHIRATIQHLVDEAEIEGFRKGKAPEKMVLEKVGENKLLESAAQSALKEIWPKTLEEKNVEAIGPAEFHILKLARGNDMSWKAIVAAVPPVQLPDYRAIAAEINKKKEKEEKEKERHRLKILDAIAEKAAVQVPSIMIDLEREKMIRELQASIEDMGLGWEEYLAHIKKTQEELIKEWAGDAERRVRAGLVLREIARKENISPTEEEISSRVQTMTRRHRQALDQERLRDYAYGIIKNDKVFQMLETC